ncbi:hypothetical protein COCSADRAFT_336250 [Bipolaris sorokiniana ND90Pr]|nr:uncharacterized protein COCSADRAFT_336250 [Bipolaris sorokiniana ND90Pr]EMD62988.1 hypothetical protein COCSADRAFT_336250 [Bipolaris sorokiniana ND90Pr]
MNRTLLLQHIVFCFPHLVILLQSSDPYLKDFRQLPQSSYCGLLNLILLLLCFACITLFLKFFDRRSTCTKFRLQSHRLLLEPFDCLSTVLIVFELLFDTF